VNPLRKIMILGAGDIGRRVFDGLANSTAARHIELVGRDEETIACAANLTRFASLQRGYHSTITYAVTDLTDTARTAERIAIFDPDVIFLAASLQSWWVITMLPSHAFERLYAANYGPWLPMHLVPVLHAMRAVRLAGSKAIVVNAAYPDAVHPALNAIGLSPHIGIGNVANNVPGIRIAAADTLGKPPADIEVRLVAHHYVSHRLSRKGNAGQASLNLAILCRGKDVTDDVDVDALLASLPTRYRRTGGLRGQAMTAASALSVLEPIADQRRAVVHAPGPLGMVGGYPVMLDSQGIHLALPGGMSAQDALKTNISGQVQDGIAEIGQDGTVVFEEASMAVLGKELGYDCPQMSLDDAPAWAAELTKRFAHYANQVNKHG